MHRCRCPARASGDCLSSLPFRWYLCLSLFLLYPLQFASILHSWLMKLTDAYTMRNRKKQLVFVCETSVCVYFWTCLCCVYCIDGYKHCVLHSLQTFVSCWFSVWTACTVMKMPLRYKWSVCVCAWFRTSTVCLCVFLLISCFQFLLMVMSVRSYIYKHLGRKFMFI